MAFIPVSFVFFSGVNTVRLLPPPAHQRTMSKAVTSKPLTNTIVTTKKIEDRDLRASACNPMRDQVIRLSRVIDTPDATQRRAKQAARAKRRRSAAFREEKEARETKKARILAKAPPNCGYTGCKAKDCPANDSFERQEENDKCSWPGCRNWLIGGIKRHGRYAKYWFKHTTNCEDRLKEPLWVGGGIGYGRHLDLPNTLTICEPHFWRLMDCAGFK